MTDIFFFLLKSNYKDFKLTLTLFTTFHLVAVTNKCFNYKTYLFIMLSHLLSFLSLSCFPFCIVCNRFRFCCTCLFLPPLFWFSACHLHLFVQCDCHLYILFVALTSVALSTILPSFHRANFQVTLSICLLSSMYFFFMMMMKMMMNRINNNWLYSQKFDTRRGRTSSFDTFSRATKGGIYRKSGNIKLRGLVNGGASK